MARRKKVPVKGSTRKTSRRKRRGGKASPPPDNPLLRHEELDIDRRIEGEDQVVESPSLVAAMAAATGKRARAKRVKKSRESTVKRLCKLRLAALAKSGVLPGDEFAGLDAAPQPTASGAVPAWGRRIVAGKDGGLRQRGQPQLAESLDRTLPGFLDAPRSGTLTGCRCHRGDQTRTLDDVIFAFDAAIDVELLMSKEGIVRWRFRLSAAPFRSRRSAGRSFGADLLSAGHGSLLLLQSLRARARHLLGVITAMSEPVRFCAEQRVVWWRLGFLQRSPSGLLARDTFGPGDFFFAMPERSTSHWVSA